MTTRTSLTMAQRVVLTAAFVPMLATGIAGGVGTYSNISRAYGTGTALGAVAAGEGATAVLALVLLGLTMLGQSSPASSGWACGPCPLPPRSWRRWRPMTRAAP